MRVLMDPMSVIGHLLLFCHWKMEWNVFVAKMVLLCQKELFSGARETSSVMNRKQQGKKSIPKADTLKI